MPHGVYVRTLPSLQGYLQGKIDIRGDEECWPCKGVPRSDGYGAMCYDGKAYSGHRLVWQAANGPIPKGLDVMHSCDNRICCNIRHLSLGTRADNVRDMWAKGRANHYVSLGQDHGMARLGDNDVFLIRMMLAGGKKQKDIAADYGITQAMVSKINTGAAWKHLPIIADTSMIGWCQ